MYGLKPVPFTVTCPGEGRLAMFGGILRRPTRRIRSICFFSSISVAEERNAGANAAPAMRVQRNELLLVRSTMQAGRTDSQSALFSGAEHAESLP